MEQSMRILQGDRRTQCLGVLFSPTGPPWGQLHGDWTGHQEEKEENEGFVC